LSAFFSGRGFVHVESGCRELQLDDRRSFSCVVHHQDAMLHVFGWIGR
jgi:hypothetical protein